MIPSQADAAWSPSGGRGLAGGLRLAGPKTSEFLWLRKRNRLRLSGFRGIPLVPFRRRGSHGRLALGRAQGQRIPPIKNIELLSPGRQLTMKVFQCLGSGVSEVHQIASAL